MTNYSEPKDHNTLVNWKRLNAYGPFSMGVWQNSSGIKVGNQESMDGRAEVMLQKLRSELLSEYSIEQIKNMSIVDIGCHDGWLLHNLSDLPFKSMTGIEPREKNIKKGVVVREELGLTNEIEFIVGDITALGSRTFDVVVSTGVLYHVESIPFFLRELKKICNEFLFIESRTIDSKLISKKIIKQSELVDLPYKFNEKLIGLSMHKFETAYSDGSAHNDIVVSLPTPEAIVMYLKSLDFKDIKLVLGAKKFREEINRKDRPLDGVCITAKILKFSKNFNQNNYKSIGIESTKKIESIYENSVLPEKILYLLRNLAVSKKPLYPLKLRRLWLWLQTNNFHNTKLEKKIINAFKLDLNQITIFKDLKYSLLDKTDLELAKLDYYNENYKNSRERFESLITKPNADWRSIYRAYYFLTLIGKKLKDNNLIIDSKAGLITCNPQHPSLTSDDQS